ncbi:MAG: tetratricopeptide repeat protein [Gemmatimonadaceae bacterium]
MAWAAASTAHAQEFTRQALMVANLRDSTAGAKGRDLKLERRAGDVLRAKVQRFNTDKQLEVLTWGEVQGKMRTAGYPEENLSDIRALKAASWQLRSDEFLVGTVQLLPNGDVRLAVDLRLVRDARLRQPLPVATAHDLNQAAEQVARSLVVARRQLPYERRCENALRDGKGAEALVAARAGIAATPEATISRVCLGWALRTVGTPADQVLGVAREVLARDPVSPHALEIAAGAAGLLRMREVAGDYWMRLMATDPRNADLVALVADGLANSDNAPRAGPLIDAAADSSPSDLRLRWLQWRIQLMNRKWAAARVTGERLVAGDKAALRDSAFVWRLATVYRETNDPVRAIAMASRGVTDFPGDARLYAFYARLVREERDVVVARGLGQFPRDAELLALKAAEQKAAGNLRASLATSREIASTGGAQLTQSLLMVAQTQFELGDVDSVATTLHEALAATADSVAIADFALAKGNALQRAATASKDRAQFQRALQLLALADSVRASARSRFLVGATAFQVAQSALVDAPKAADKPRSCALARLGELLLPLAREGLTAGAEIAPDAARQYLGYADQLEPFIGRQIAAFCG